MRNRLKIQGFTLLEVVFVLVILTVVGTMALSLFEGMDDAQRYELTRAKMEAIRRAVLGTEQLDAQGRRANFGYHGDFGALPPSLAALTTPQAPAWAFHGTLGFGVGWRGPYYQPEFTDGFGVGTDFWGNAFVYSTTSLTSLGSDGAAGGTVYDQDLVMVLGTADRLSRVKGVVRDGTTGLSGRTVRIFVPSAGNVSTWSAVTDANGFFLFTGVPFGQRAVMATDSPTLGPKPVTVDAPEVFIPPDTLNYFGAVQKVVVDTSAVGCGASDRLHHWVEVSNSYLGDVTADFITVWWESTSRLLNTIMLNSVSQSAALATSGTRIDITKNLTIPAGATRRFELRWSGKGDLQNVAAQFEWEEYADKDHIAWVTTTCANPAIMVTNPVDAEEGGTDNNITLGYTVPPGAISPTLVVVGSGQDTNNDGLPTGATFGATKMNEIAEILDTNSGTREGIGMYWLAVTAGQKGTITVTYAGSSSSHTLHAYTLTSTDQNGPEASQTAANGFGQALANITTLSDDAVVAVGTVNGNNVDLSPVGPNHIMDSMRVESDSSSALGHVSVGPAATINGLGYDGSSMPRQATILGSFVYLP